MSGAFTNFLKSISGTNSAIKRIQPYNLKTVYPHNHLFQQILEMLFGQDGTEIAGILDNKHLSDGEKSFFIKVAMFAKPEFLRKFLDKLYTFILAESEENIGYDWELLASIKKINEHCYNWDTAIPDNNGIGVKFTTVNDLLFANTGRRQTDVLGTEVVRSAIFSLLKLHIEQLGANARVNGLGKLYAKDQWELAARLDLKHIKTSPAWRLEFLDLYPQYYMELQGAKGMGLVSKWQDRETKHEQSMLNAYEAHKNTGCYNPLCEFRIRRKMNKKRQENT